jgi:hypothetical protein
MVLSAAAAAAYASQTSQQPSKNGYLYFLREVIAKPSTYFLVFAMSISLYVYCKPAAFQDNDAPKGGGGFRSAGTNMIRLYGFSLPTMVLMLAAGDMFISRNPDIEKSDVSVGSVRGIFGGLGLAVGMYLAGVRSQDRLFKNMAIAVAILLLSQMAAVDQEVMDDTRGMPMAQSREDLPSGMQYGSSQEVMDSLNPMGGKFGYQ